MGKQNDSGAEDIQQAIVSALGLLNRWQMKLVYLIIREILRR